MVNKENHSHGYWPISLSAASCVASSLFVIISSVESYIRGVCILCLFIGGFKSSSCKYELFLLILVGKFCGL